jgi:hypothetical protein
MRQAFTITSFKQESSRESSTTFMRQGDVVDYLRSRSRPQNELSISEVTSTSQTGAKFSTTRTETEIDEVRREIAAKLGQIDMPGFPQTYRVSGMQKWDGRIVEIEDGFFTAELSVNGTGPTVLADFDVSQLGPDADLVVGDVVYVTVRTVAGVSGYPSRTSAIRLRRLGNWTEEEIRQQADRASEKLHAFEQFVD